MSWEEYDDKYCFECIFFSETNLYGRGKCKWFVEEFNGTDSACHRYENKQTIKEYV